MEVLSFAQNSNIKQDLKRAMFYIFKDGRYYGLIREKEDSSGAFVFDMPIDYCRVMRKDLYGRWILEFDLRYFDNIKVEVGQDRNSYRESILLSMPNEIQEAYRAFKRKIA
jgi:hypothetical protein